MEKGETPLQTILYFASLISYDRHTKRPFFCALCKPGDKPLENYTSNLFFAFNTLINSVMVFSLKNNNGKGGYV